MAVTMRHNDFLKAHGACLPWRSRQADVTAATEAFVSQLALKTHDEGKTYHVVWAGDYDSIYNEDLRKLVENFLKARLALEPALLLSLAKGQESPVGSQPLYCEHGPDNVTGKSCRACGKPLGFVRDEAGTTAPAHDAPTAVQDGADSA